MNLSACILFACLIPPVLQAELVRFDDLKEGQTPSSWIATITGTGDAKWEIVADDSAPTKPHALKQSGIAPQASFPICLKEGVSLKDGWAEVKFKAIAGKIDQAAGIVWRARDRNNYYVCRANALEDNVVLYKVDGGKRTALDIVGRIGGYGVTTKVTGGQWHTLRVEFSGARFKVLFDNQELFRVEDDTFTRDGMVGVWTKADSVTLFDDFAYGGR